MCEQLNVNEQLAEANRRLIVFNTTLTEIEMRGVDEVKIDLIRTLLKSTEEALKDDQRGAQQTFIPDSCDR